MLTIQNVDPSQTRGNVAPNDHASTSSQTQTQADIHQYLKSLPPGYRFSPTDDELIEHYLSRKVRGQSLPINNIHEVDIYKCNPHDLACKYGTEEDQELYFFTPRNRKYRSGKRASRTAGNGCWKGSNGEAKILRYGKLIGTKTPFAFETEKGKKHDWLMQEYRLPDGGTGLSTKTDENDMLLDKLVLCKIYKKKPGKINSVHTKTGGSFDEYAKHEYLNQEDMFDASELSKKLLKTDDGVGVPNEPHSITSYYENFGLSLPEDGFMQNNNSLPLAANSMGTSITDQCYDFYEGMESFLSHLHYPSHAAYQDGEAVIAPQEFSAVSSI